MRTRVVVAALLVLALSIISTTFTLLATKSESWATQAYYFGDVSNVGLNETNVTCVYERSPFYRCALPQVNSSGYCNITDCHFYKPYGRNQTSCRSATEFNRTYDEQYLAMGLLGQGQECQQVHYAGSLQIAASVFNGLGLVLALILSLATLAVAFSPKYASAASAAHHPKPHHQSGTHKHTVESTVHSRPSCSEHEATKSDSLSSAVPYVVALLLACLYIGALTQIMAQYFGVLGLTVNATPKDTDAARTAVTNPNFTNFQTDTWIIGKGLSTYATIAWASAVACAALATALFRTPRFPKVL